MKIVVRTFALALVATGIAAGAYAKNAASVNQTSASAAPVPTCPLNTSGCGIWQ